MIKLRDVIRECRFDHTVETEIVKFLTHNQNSHVHEELLKNMKDGDSLNTILGYAKHVEGTQHSENLSKAYLDTIKIPNTGVKIKQLLRNVLVQEKNKSLNIDLKARVSLKATFVIVLQIMHQKSAPPMGRHVITAKRKVISNSVVDQLGTIARVVQDGSSIPTKDNPGMNSMRYQLPTMVAISKITPVGSHIQTRLNSCCVQ